MPVQFRGIVARLAILSLAACGGGGDDYVRDGQRACPGPFSGGIVQACAIELRLAGDETIRARITGRLVAGPNTGSELLQVLRNVRIQAAGESLAVRTLGLELQPGQAGAVDFTLEAEVPAANLGGFAAVIGLSSTEIFGASQVVDVAVSASATSARP